MIHLDELRLPLGGEVGYALGPELGETACEGPRR